MTIWRKKNGTGLLGIHGLGWLHGDSRSWFKAYPQLALRFRYFRNCKRYVPLTMDRPWASLPVFATICLYMRSVVVVVRGAQHEDLTRSIDGEMFCVVCNSLRCSPELFQLPIITSRRARRALGNWAHICDLPYNHCWSWLINEMQQRRAVLSWGFLPDLFFLLVSIHEISI
ncbi:hypothetical protein EYC84_004387 [Monilinia fructicola]|uniref:Uncharacterized protein n=1 Tax=Monilinia fructicola TaxID=38448 RepID=A0A5M9K2Q1_MONFR|nr:hypothetical protein EYC84_004387 [Monilinia fructicola]